MAFNPAVGRQESMRWAAPEQSYDGGDWADPDELAEEAGEEVEEAKSIKSEDLQVGGGDYQDIYDYYEQDEESIKRHTYQKQLEDEIYEQLTPGHSRNASVDSQVEPDPELAELYEGTSEYLARPISVYANGPQVAPLSFGHSESDRHIRAILTPGKVDEEDEETPVPTPIARDVPPLSSVLDSTVKEPELAEPSEQPPFVPEPKEQPPPSPQAPVLKLNGENKEDDEDVTPLHSPSLAALAVTPSKLPAFRSDDEAAEILESLGKEPEAEPKEEVGFPSLALTCATPEGSDEEAEEDVREKPDWQPRWAPDEAREAKEPEAESEKEIEDGIAGVNLHESQISLDMSEASSMSSRPSGTARIQGFIDEEPSEDENDEGSDAETIGEAPSLAERSTVGSLEQDKAIDEDMLDLPATPAKDPLPIASKVSRAPVIDLKAVFALNTSTQRQEMLWDLRVREENYSTQLDSWLRSTFELITDKSTIYVAGEPPEADAHALPVSRQVGTTLSNSGVKTKETFIKVGDRGKKGLHAMKKLMRHN